MVHKKLQSLFLLSLFFIIVGMLENVPAAEMNSIGVRQKSVLLGGHQPLSGALSWLADIQKGAQAYFQYINDQGGLHGRQIEWLVYDDQLQKMRAELIGRKLVFQDQIFAMFHGMGDQTHQTIQNFLEQRNIPDFLIGSNLETWTDPIKKGVFGLDPTIQTEQKIMTRYFKKMYAGRSLAVWHLNDKVINEEVQSLVKQLRPHFPKIQTVTYTNGPMEPGISQIKTIHPDALLILAPEQETHDFIKEAYQYGMEGEIYLKPQILFTDWVETLDPSLRQMLYFFTWQPYVHQMDHPGITLHHQLLGYYFPKTKPSQWSVSGQIAAEIMVEILNRTGRSLTTEAVLQATESLTAWQGHMTPPITLSRKNHLAITQMRIGHFENERFAFTSDWITAQ
ncbi:MAG: ABC transporter substrate-binding protein [SAR324 cluster bacterium]|nr:ABC transporter substrate-binding protein [SAR324 cluster bacterium]